MTDKLRIVIKIKKYNIAEKGNNRKTMWYFAGDGRP